MLVPEEDLNDSPEFRCVQKLEKIE